MKALRESPTFTVHPWVTGQPRLLPDNPKDAYLIEATERYRPQFLLTFDKALLDLDFIGTTIVATPALVLSTWDSVERDEL